MDSIMQTAYIDHKSRLHANRYIPLFNPETKPLNPALNAHQYHQNGYSLKHRQPSDRYRTAAAETARDFFVDIV
jgi:hypothetical protein